MKNIRTMALFCGAMTLALALSVGGTLALLEGKPKSEQIDAVAQGTGIQLGKEFRVTLIINRYSSRADRQLLVQAFEKDRNQGLVDALSKMKSVGHIAITGTLGYDVSYIRLIPTSTGRTIRFITNRPLSFREESTLTHSGEYNLTAGEFELNDTDKSKSKGVLYPLAKLAMDHDKQVTFEMYTDPYALTDVIDYRKQ